MSKTNAFWVRSACSTLHIWCRAACWSRRSRICWIQLRGGTQSKVITKVSVVVSSAPGSPVDEIRTLEKRIHLCANLSDCARVLLFFSHHTCTMYTREENCHFSARRRQRVQQFIEVVVHQPPCVDIRVLCWNGILCFYLGFRTAPNNTFN